MDDQLQQTAVEASLPSETPSHHFSEDPSSSAAVLDVSRASLARLCESHSLSADAWNAAMSFCGFWPRAGDWRYYWRYILLLGGMLFLAAGTIFFFAANWADMHRFTRMGIVGALVAVAGIGASWRDPDTALGSALLLFCGICVGPLLAVFGQTYQTGSELWELFRVWTAVLFALALVGRQVALWFVTWLSANVFVMLWLGRSMDSPLEAIGMFSLLPECILGLALAVAVWEWMAYRAQQRGAASVQTWLQSRWMPRLLFFDLTVRLAVYLCLVILDPYPLHYLTKLFLPLQILPFFALFVFGVSWVWHRKKIPDLFMLACLVSASAVLIVTILLRAEFLFDAGVGALFVWGMLLVGITTSVAAILLVLQREMKRQSADDSKDRPDRLVFSFFAPKKPLPSWNALWAYLQGKGLVAPEEPLPVLSLQEPGTAAPWYVRTILALGGWVASLIFLAFLVLFLFVTMNINDNEGRALFFASLVPLGIAFVCLKRSEVFLRNFGFSLALTGTIGVCAGLGWMRVDDWETWPLLFAGVLTLLYPVMNSGAYRVLAVFLIVQLVAVGSVVAVNAHALPFNVGQGELDAWFAVRRQVLHMTALWWVAASMFLAAYSLWEKRWRVWRVGKYAEPLFFGAYGGMMGYCLVTICSRHALFSFMFDMNDMNPLALFFWIPSVGLGAAVGLCFFVNALLKGQGMTPQRIAVAGCTVLALPIGWYLPGVALAAFGLALSRYLGSLVMNGVTCAFLFLYMIYYYYFLGISLMQKSLFLAATGGGLLFLAWALNRFGGWFATQEAAHA